MQKKKKKLHKEVASLIYNEHFYKFNKSYIGEYQNHTRSNKDQGELD